MHILLKMAGTKSQTDCKTAMDDLRERLWNLPPELYLMVREDVLSLQIPDVTPVTNDYLPPVQLRLCRKLRSSVAEAYYGKAKFQFANHVLLAKWLASLPERHRRLLQCVRLDTYPKIFQGRHGPWRARMALQSKMHYLYRALAGKIPGRWNLDYIFLNAMGRVGVDKWTVIWLGFGDRNLQIYRALKGSEQQ